MWVNTSACWLVYTLFVKVKLLQVELDIAVAELHSQTNEN